MHRARFSRRLLLAVTAAALVCAEPRGSVAAEDELVVVVSARSSIQSASRDTLRPIFLTTRSTWPDGGKATPLNLPDAHTLRHRFDRAVLRLEPDEAAKYWTDRKIRGGARPPRRLPTPSAVARAVAEDATAVGYVRRSDVTAALRIIAVVRGDSVGPP
jgi:ABC-type phosphate transport system substrate-binding protein